MAANPVNPTPDLQIDEERAPSQTTFRCIGRVNASTAPLLREKVRKALDEKRDIVLDLSNVVHMDSSGLGALVGLWASARKAGCEMKLVSLSQRVKELLRLTSLDKVLSTTRFPDTPSF